MEKRSSTATFPALAFLLALWFAWPLNGLLRAQGDLLVISGGTLVDVNDGSSLKDALVIISQGRIREISQVGKISVPAGARVIDATGKTLLPGFIDGHVHFREWHGELYLANGVTTVVDTGDADEWTLALKHARDLGKIRTPRIFGSGARLGAEVAIRRRDLIRPVNPPRPHFLYISLEEAKRRIHEKKKAGMTLIKVDETWTREHLEELVSLAHSLNLPIVGHSSSPRDSALAGLDAIFHFWGVLPGTVVDPSKLEDIRRGRLEDIWSAMDPAAFPDLISLLVSRKVIIDAQPVLDGQMQKQAQYELQDYRLLARPELQYVPLLARVAIFRKHHELLSKTPAEKESFTKYQRFLREFVQAGGKLMTGTDSIISALPGAAFRRNMIAMQEAGIDRVRILQAATKNPAELYQFKDLGTIEPGKLADLQIIDGDPLKDLNDLEHIEKVLIGGEIVDTGFHADYSPGFDRPYAEDASPVNPPVLGGIEPRWAVEGSDGLEITVAGSGYDRFTTVLFNGMRLPTRLVSATRLKASIGADQLRSPGTHRVSLDDPRFLGRRSEQYYGFIVSYR